MPDVPSEPASAGDALAATPVAPTPPEGMLSSQQPRRPRAPRKRATCPDPGSIYDILRENCGTSLFVLPILWTDAHPRLLRASFVAQDPILTPMPAPRRGRSTGPPRRSGSSYSSYDQPQPSEVADILSCDLTSLLSPEDTRPFSKSRAIKNVLSTLFPAAFTRPKSVVELDVHFGDRVFRGAVRVPVVWKSADAADTASFDSAVTRPVSSFGGHGHVPNGARETNDFNSGGGGGVPSGVTSAQSSQGASDGPIVAYVNRSHLAMIRQNLFRIVPGPEGGDRGNAPVSRLQSLRSKLLMPGEPDRDAYLAGVFLAMAQAHFYDRDAPSSRAASQQMLWWSSRHRGDRDHRTAAAPPEFHDVKLRILTHDDDTSDFIVYTAVVTGAFLRRFAAPTKAAPGVHASGMRIEYARVRVWPILGLKERLGKALGRDLVGDVLHEGSGLFDDADGVDGGGSGGGGDDGMETWETAESRAKRLDSLKRKRVERAALTEMLSVTFEAEGGGSGSSDSSSGSGPTTATTVAVTSPTLSPRAKRRQTQSLSSLAVC